jgi:hypothetical protein
MLDRHLAGVGQATSGEENKYQPVQGVEQEPRLEGEEEESGPALLQVIR